MTEQRQSKAVREARAKARTMAREGRAAYRQALDIVAREAGYGHWNDFTAGQPVDEVVANPKPAPRTFEPIPEYVRRGNGPLAVTRDMATVQEHDISWNAIHYSVISALTPLVTAVFGIPLVIMAVALMPYGDTARVILFLMGMVACACCAAPGLALMVRSFNATRILLRRRRLQRG